MKVIEIYTKEDLDLITCGGVPIQKLMDNLFSKFPSFYRNNYDRNMQTLELQRVDEMNDSNDMAIYYPKCNVILFKSFMALIHEFMHMASSDLVNNKYAFSRANEYSLYENALLEGMAEFLACLAKDGEPDVYFFEYFAVSMLSSIDDIFEPFFTANYNKLISLFPNKRDICSLMYGLDFYHDKIDSIDIDSDNDDVDMLVDSVKGVIDSLIDIEISFKKGYRDRKEYRDKFMDLISDGNIKSLVGDVYPEYIDYAHSEVNRRVLRRIR